jgi:hypothetical protein
MGWLYAEKVFMQLLADSDAKVSQDDAVVGGAGAGNNPDL